MRTPSRPPHGWNGCWTPPLADWRERETWRRRQVMDARSGALDMPGTSWRERPAVDRGDGVFLAGDMVAAPGLLSEVSWASAIEAGRLALEAARAGPGRSCAEWPERSASSSASRRSAQIRRTAWRDSSLTPRRTAATGACETAAHRPDERRRGDRQVVARTTSRRSGATQGSARAVAGGGWG